MESFAFKFPQMKAVLKPVIPSLALVAIAFSIVTLAAAEKEPLPVFVFAGQSNMVGKRSTPAKLPAEYQGVQADVFIFTGENWEPYRPGLGQSAGFGPEVSAALALSKALDKPIGIIKHSSGGTNLALQWNPGQDRNLYTTLKNKVAAAARARPIHVAGAFWMQGGADAKSKSIANAYAENLDSLLTAMRRDFKNPSLPVVAGRSGREKGEPHPKYPFLPVVRAAQMKERKYYASIDCSDITRGSDNIHYDTLGMVKLGQEFASAMLAFWKEEADD